jgi:predicted restriction endonuclease
MKITRYSVNEVETQTDAICFRVMVVTFRLDAVIENKHYFNMANLWYDHGARVYEPVFLGSTTTEILRNWSYKERGKPNFKAINALVRFWETLEEKENKMKTKQRL